MVILAVRMKGTVNIPYWARSTLNCLNLKSKFSATLLPESDDYFGMLRKVAHIVAWGKADESIVRELVMGRGKMVGSVPLDDANVLTEFGSIDNLIKSIVENKVKLSEVKSMKPFFRLSPPRGGFKRKSKKLFTDGGILGNNKELQGLVRRML
ncbi:MAG TPA: 50S ribosomal protein L30 [Nitrososphaeraceae archaeon]|jgi:large subunit ribosomal protein L30